MATGGSNHEGNGIFINRLLVFIFATDESFEQLMNLPKKPFTMVCGNQLCVSVTAGTASTK